MADSIALFALPIPPSVGTRHILLLQPLQGTIKPKRASRIVAMLGNLHDGQGISIALLSRSNIAVGDPAF